MPCAVGQCPGGIKSNLGPGKVWAGLRQWQLRLWPFVVLVVAGCAAAHGGRRSLVSVPAFQVKSKEVPIMDRPAATTPATAREIILEIVRNMREGLEPLHYSTLAPTLYHVYLHPDDMERLRGIIPRIVEEARRALDAELESLNRASLGDRLKIARRGEPKIAP